MFEHIHSEKFHKALSSSEKNEVPGSPTWKKKPLRNKKQNCLLKLFYFTFEHMPFND